MQLFASDVQGYFRLSRNSNASTGADFGLSLALLAVGHLVGLWVGVAMLVGVLISWAGAVPWLTSRSRTRCSAWRSSCSNVLVATNFMVGRCTASAMASASRKSFFCPLE